MTSHLVSSSAVDAVPRTPATDVIVPAGRQSRLGSVAAVTAWLLVAAITGLWPDQSDSDWARTGDLATLIVILAAFVAVLGQRFGGIAARLQRAAPRQIALALFVAGGKRTVSSKTSVGPLDIIFKIDHTYRVKLFRSGSPRGQSS